jgi:4'-phosphopantetheinyl transferase
LTPTELTAITGAQTSELILWRLYIILCLKLAYMRAIGQSVAFDWARLEFDVDNKSATADGHALTGWEFRLYRAKLGVARGSDPPKLVEEEYQCCVAFFRGCDDLKFIWYDDSKALESWVQFITIDQMTKVIPKLSA